MRLRLFSSLLCSIILFIEQKHAASQATIQTPYPDVVTEVLERAASKCEECSQTAPLCRSPDDPPYLEVHHRIPLAEKGEDTLENAIALCPNCHIQAHFG